MRGAFVFRLVWCIAAKNRRCPFVFSSTLCKIQVVHESLASTVHSEGKKRHHEHDGQGGSIRGRCCKRNTRMGGCRVGGGRERQYKYHITKQPNLHDLLRKILDGLGESILEEKVVRLDVRRDQTLLGDERRVGSGRDERKGKTAETWIMDRQGGTGRGGAEAWRSVGGTRWAQQGARRGAYIPGARNWVCRVAPRTQLTLTS